MYKLKLISIVVLITLTLIVNVITATIILGNSTIVATISKLLDNPK